MLPLSRRTCLVSGWSLCSHSQILLFTLSYHSTYWDPVSLPPFISPTLLFGGREPWCNTLARLPGQKPHTHTVYSPSSALLSLTHQHPQIHHLTVSRQFAAVIIPDLMKQTWSKCRVSSLTFQPAHWSGWSQCVRPIIVKKQKYCKKARWLTGKIACLEIA